MVLQVVHVAEDDHEVLEVSCQHLHFEVECELRLKK